MIKAEIKKVGGYPAIVIDGKPYPSTQMITITSKKDDKIVLDKDYVKQVGQAGIKVFFIVSDTAWNIPSAEQEFTQICQMILDVVPDAYFLVRIGMHPPVDFLLDNPDECFTYNDGSQPSALIWNESFKKVYPKQYSYCSQKWRERASKALCDTCDFFDTLPYADRIIGYFFAAGGTSEWYYLAELVDGDKYGDFSLAFKREYSKILRKKYGTEENLRKAWKMPNATFDDPYIPNVEERFYAFEFDKQYRVLGEGGDELTTIATNGTNIGSFLDVDKYLCVFDFYQAWHLATAQSQIYFAKIIKEKYNGTKLTGAFYGSYGCTDYFNTSTTTGVLEILNSDVMDFLAAPGVYVNRQLGGFAGQREMTESFAIRNKLFIVEDDTRTHKEEQYFRSTFDLYDSKDSVNALKRDFGRNLSGNLASWWFDQHKGGGRYNDKDILAFFAQQTQIANEALQLTDRQKHNEIAFIFDEESVHTVSLRTTKECVEYFRNYELARVGASADEYYHNDLSNPNMPDYKLYVFFNVFAVTDEERNQIRQKLAKNHATAVWVYASGVINFDKEQKFSNEYIKHLTGINVGICNEKHFSKYRVLPNKLGIFDNVSKRKIYGMNDRPFDSNVFGYVEDAYTLTFVAPLFYADDKDSVTVAKFLVNDLPAISVKDTGDFTSIFYGSKIVNSAILREIAKFCGCHVWLDSDDVCYASDNYLTIHATTDGVKTINLKHKCSPYEVYEQKFYGKNVTQIQVEMSVGDTLTFALTKNP